VRSHRDHVVIADAILSGDGDAAENAMRNHLKGTAEWILQLPNSAFGLDL
jgi:DNA-binding FadR family transcriptional regulator